MKVVIDIPENDYKLACNYPDALIACYAHYIKAGTLLPKEHGRLIDADALRPKTLEEEAYLFNCNALAVINNAPTVIEAEGEDFI